MKKCKHSKVQTQHKIKKDKIQIDKKKLRKYKCNKIQVEQNTNRTKYKNMSYVIKCHKMAFYDIL